MKKNNIILVACLGLLFAACSEKQPADNHDHEAEEKHTEGVAELSEEQIKTVDIKLGKVANRALNSVVKATGEVQLNPQDMADVNSLIQGIVRRILVTEGQQVRAGQVVAYVENTDIVSLQKDYFLAVKETAAALQELQRQKSLAAQRAGVEKNLQQAASAYDLAMARQTGLANQLAQLGVSAAQAGHGKVTTQVAVKAPIAGVVTKVNARNGSYADNSAPLLQIANTSAAFCSLNIFERNIGQVHVGQAVDLVVTNNPSLHFSGVVSQINRTVDPTTKAIAVHVRVKGLNPSLLMPGMYVTGLLNTGKHGVTALPDDAIISAEGKKYVFLLDKKEKEDGQLMYHFRRVEVVTGTSELGFTQVDFLTPVKADATFVTGNAFYIASMTSEHGEHAH